MSTRKRFVALALCLLVGGAVLVASWGSWHKIPQNGMYPSLPAGSYLLARSNPYANPSDVQRGDVVVFERTEDGRQNLFVWRVVALPGDTVEAVGPRLAVNGAELARVRVRDEGDYVIYQESNPPASYEVAYPKTEGAELPPSASLTVPPAEFFVMGDNRDQARDSRYFGTIPFEAITGKYVWSPRPVKGGLPPNKPLHPPSVRRRDGGCDRLRGAARALVQVVGGQNTPLLSE